MDDSALLERQHGKASLAFVYLAFLFPAMAGFLFGYDIGSTSGAVRSLRLLVGFEAKGMWTSATTSASLMGATLGSVLAFWVGEPLGRRRELLVGSSLYLFGSLLCVAAPESGAAYGAVFAGRWLYGLGVAFSMHAAPVYISEMAPSAVRGMLVGGKEGFIVGGILAGFAAAAVGEAALPATSVFRGVWALPVPISLVIFGGMWLMPPSPRWLLLRAASSSARQDLEGSPVLDPGGRSAALAALSRFRRGSSPSAVEAELAAIEATLAEVSVARAGSWAEMLTSRRALLAGLGLISLQQLTGQPSVLYYQDAIFRDAGFGDFASKAGVLVGVAKLAATVCSVAAVDRFGRRPLLQAGIGMMTMALLLLAVGFQFKVPGEAPGEYVLPPGAWPPVVVFALMLYVCGYQVGFGPIAWLIISEVFPIKTRTRALSMAVTVNFGFNLLVTFLLSPLQTALDALSPGKGSSYLFAIYAALCLVSSTFVHACVPETKGKSLEQIEAMLR